MTRSKCVYQVIFLIYSQIKMKKNKLELRELKLKSFVTEMNTKVEQTIKGGISSSPEELRSVRELCPTNLIFCP